MSTATLPTSVTRPAAFGQRLFTVADFAVLPTRLPTGDVRYELNDGVLVVMSPPGDIHGRQQAQIVRYLASEAEDRGLGQVRAEVCVILRRGPDRVVAPDAAFLLAESLPVRRSKEGYLETIPEIVVEIRSKNDTTNEVRAKKDEYFDAGVQVVWVLDPDEKTVTTHRPGRPPQVFTTADTLTDVLLPGFAVPVDRLFAGV